MSLPVMPFQSAAGATDATLTAFRFSGSEAVATARKATQHGGFTLVELSRDTWTRGEDGWKLMEHVPLQQSECA